jgi:polygalacturonase
MWGRPSACGGLSGRPFAGARQDTKSWTTRGVYFLLALFAINLSAQPVYNAKDYGASGKRADDARPAIQRAIDESGKAGGGTVYLPPGEYTSGQLRLRSGVRVYIEAGAVLYASLDSKQFEPAPKSALFFGEDLHDIALEGRGTVDGQASYEWRPNEITDHYILPNQRLMEATRKPLLRSFPAGFPKETVYPRLVLLLRCDDVRIAGLRFLRSRSWTINPYACNRIVIDGVYIYSSLKEAVWADGIDPDGCRDVRISNSTIETGDDAIVFYSSDIWGPALPTENVTVTNCRLSSASSALKFCDGNRNAVRRVAVDNIVITNSNRGLAFMVFDGGIVEDVVISNATIETRRFDWFWWGDGDPIHFNIKRRSEIDGVKREGEPRAGVIRNVTLRNIIAHGAGASTIEGHPDSPLEGIRFEGVRLSVARDPAAPYEHTREAVSIRHARDLAMKDVEIGWSAPASKLWQSGLRVEDADGVLLEGAVIEAGPDADTPAVDLWNSRNVTVRNSRAATVHVSGAGSDHIRVIGSDARVTSAPGVPAAAIGRE